MQRTNSSASRLLPYFVQQNMTCPAHRPARTLLLLASALPDLILTDISLPGIDGSRLTRQLKGDPRTRCIPVVALTASAMKADEQKALAAGCVGHITRPIQARELASRIRQFLVRSPQPGAS